MMDVTMDDWNFIIDKDYKNRMLWHVNFSCDRDRRCWPLFQNGVKTLSTIICDGKRRLLDCCFNTVDEIHRIVTC